MNRTQAIMELARVGQRLSLERAQGRLVLALFDLYRFALDQQRFLGASNAENDAGAGGVAAETIGIVCRAISKELDGVAALPRAIVCVDQPPVDIADRFEWIKPGQPLSGRSFAVAVVACQLTTPELKEWAGTSLAARATKVIGWVGP